MLRSPNQKSSSQPDLQNFEKDKESLNITSRKRKNPDVSEIELFKKEVRSMLLDWKKEQDQNHYEVCKGIDEVKKLIEISAAECQNIKTKVENIILEHDNVLKRIDHLEEQLEEVQKIQRQNKIETRNVPDSKDNLKEIISTISKTIKFDVQDEGITEIYRMKRGDKGPIIVEFKEKANKENFIKAVKTYNHENKNNKLNSEIFQKDDNKLPIYVSDLLTPKTKMLHYHARGLQKKGIYQYCWISKGRIMLRKKEGDTPIILKSLKQLESISPQPISE